MIKSTCFHPHSVATSDSTILQWDLESQESLEREKANKRAFLEWNNIYSKYTFSAKPFLTAFLFYSPENKGVFF